jgi:phosphinothricin acetyltransferase
MSDSVLVIRPASASDSDEINAIYNHYVRSSTATFDTEEITAEKRLTWLDEHVGDYPALVAVRDGMVVGWGSLSPWGTRCAYRRTVEISIYIDANATGGGVGPALGAALAKHARELGHHAIVSQIVHENEASLKMARRLGYEQVGRLREVGRKFDRWLDVVLMEYVIDPA